MTYYALRTDVDTSSVDSVITYVTSISNVFAYVLEDEETNPHLHWYIQTNTNAPAIRAQIRKRIGTGNGKYSLKTIGDTQDDHVKYLAYIMKTCNHILHNIDPELAKLATLHDAKIKEDLKTKKEDKKRSNIITKLEEYVWPKLEEGPYSSALESPWDAGNQICIGKYVVQYLVEENRVINKSQVVTYTQTLIVRRFPHLTNFWLNEIFKNVN